MHHSTTFYTQCCEVAAQLGVRREYDLPGVRGAAAGLQSSPLALLGVRSGQSVDARIPRSFNSTGCGGGGGGGGGALI